MSDDEDDPVVDEIPVYLTHDLSDNLFVFQFPVQPAASASNQKIVKSRIKPENQEVVLEVGLDTTSVNFDKSHGEQIAANLDKDKPASQRAYPTKIMDRLRLESTRSLIDRDCFAVGTMSNGEMIISPIRGVVSLAPSFSHISQVEEKDSEGEEDAAEVVRVQYPRVNERAKRAREASYTHYIEKTGVEPWFNTQFHDVDSAIAKLERTRLTSGFVRGSKPLDLTSYNYLNALLPKEVDLGGTKAPSLPDHVTSMTNLKELPLKDQVHKILEQVRAVDASQISWILNCEKSKIIDCLQTCAVLVQGNWVLRSDLLYKGNVNGIPAAAMANARDYILHEFHSGKCIERKELGIKLGIPADEIKHMMARLAVLRKNKLWQFRLPVDESFLREYSEIVDQQNLLWEARMRDINEQLATVMSVTTPTKSRRRKESEQSTASTDMEVTEGLSATPKSGRRRRNSDRAPERRKDSEHSITSTDGEGAESSGEPVVVKGKSSGDSKEKSSDEKRSLNKGEDGKPKKKQRKRKGHDEMSAPNNKADIEIPVSGRNKSETLNTGDMPVPISAIKQEPVIKQEPPS